MTSTFKIGDLHIGVRSNTLETGARVRRSLAQYLVEDVEAPPNYSVILANGDGVGRGLNLLYRSWTTIIRSRYPSRVLRGLVRHLGQFDPSDPEYLRARVVALVRDRQAILVPDRVFTWTDILTPRLHRQGWQFVDAPFVDIDPKTAELVVTETEVAHLAAEIPEEVPTRSEPAPVPPGRYPLLGWAFMASDQSARGLMTLGAATARAMAALSDPGDRESIESVEAVTDLLRRVVPYDIGSAFEGDLAAKLTAMPGS